MSHGSQTVEIANIVCPEGCVSTHPEGEALHLFPERVVRDTYGKLIHVSAFADYEAGRFGVYVGEHEVFLEEASELTAAVTAAYHEAALASVSRPA